MPMELINPVDCPYYLITRASLTITSILKRRFASAGVERLNPAYLGVLLSLWRHEDRKAETSPQKKLTQLKANELAKMAGLEPSTMTGLLDRMERDALITRSAVPNDRRAQHISLTQRGYNVRESVLKIVDQVLDEVFRDISNSDLESTKNVLRTVLANNK